MTAFTPSGTPLIYPQTDRILALTAGNGAGAKLAMEGSIADEGYLSGFRP